MLGQRLLTLGSARRKIVASVTGAAALTLGINLLPMVPAHADEGVQTTISGDQLQGSNALPSDTQINVPATPFVTDGSSAPFDRDTTVSWALAHAQDAEPFGAACTWFVTQALWAGGIPQNPDWNSDGTHGFLRPRPGTPAATAVTPFLDALLRAYPASRFEPLSMTQNSVPNAQVGDLIVYSWDGTNWDHLTMITGFADGDYPLVSEWGTGGSLLDQHPATPYAQRGWTWSALHNEWLQQEQPNVEAALIHIDTTIPTTY